MIKYEDIKYNNGCYYYKGNLFSGQSISNCGTVRYHKNGKFHRLDGPAIEWSSGNKIWYYNGQRTSFSSQKEFEKYIKLKIFE